MDFISFFSHASSICFWSAVLSSCSSHSPVNMTYTRATLVNILLNSAGKSPSAEDYRARLEQYILNHFGLSVEDLSDLKKFRAYCSSFATKTRKYYNESQQKLDRMFADPAHKVISHILHTYTYKNSLCLDVF